ncbi:MAG: isochorismate synthase [Acidobacteria bacterium]|nr:isochorismate synthase [Acidobacteriota bacterium]
MSGPGVLLKSRGEAPALTPPAAELEDFVGEQLAGRLSRPGILMLTIPAPVAPPEVLLQGVEAGEDGVFWASSSGASLVGVGSCHHLALSGDKRFEQLRTRSRELFSRLEALTYPGLEAPRPRFLGGLSFAVGSADRGPWRVFGDGSFTLPRWLYRSDGQTATLSITLDGSADETPGVVLGELAARLERLETAATEPEAALADLGGHAVPVAVDQLPEELWAAQVEAIRDAIAGGRFRKIVAARRADVTFSDELEPAALLARLVTCGPHCRRFAFLRPGAAFLVASPERLIERHGRSVSTEALAGSIGSGPQQAVRLLRSTKDRSEHQLVVEHIVARLSPLCRGLDWSREPQIRELRNLLHLHTPIRGELRADTHVLDLLERLHPTPAVGGVPAAAATRWIAEHEARPRGWYSGPVGWFDAAGDGEFDVALRSCLLSGKEALVYAGAGIMLDSDPRLEYQETELKQRSLLAALGVGG